METVLRVAEYISELSAQFTCPKCGELYKQVETTVCGHFICQCQGRLKKKCLICSKTLTKKDHHKNNVIQTKIKHIQKFARHFQEDMLTAKGINISVQGNSMTKDPIKAVKEWLVSSQNQFSAPVTESVPNTLDILPSVMTAEKVNTVVTIETPSPRKLSPKPLRENYAPTIVNQDDWDKIEVVMDSEPVDIKEKENVIGPMDIEPYIFEDEEYSNNRPRRSSRHTVEKNDCKIPEPELSVDKNSNLGSDKGKSETSKSTIKQNWHNVKKMKKEFSKLSKNKRDVKKLNVSIEMVKKNKSELDKDKNIIIHATPYVIDDSTPACDGEISPNLLENATKSKNTEITEEKPNIVQEKEAHNISNESLPLSHFIVNKSDQDKVNRLQEAVTSFEKAVSEVCHIKTAVSAEKDMIADSQAQTQINTDDLNMQADRNNFDLQHNIKHLTIQKTPSNVSNVARNVSFFKKGKILTKPRNPHRRIPFYYKACCRKANIKKSDPDHMTLTITAGNTSTSIVIAKGSAGCKITGVNSSDVEMSVTKTEDEKVCHRCCCQAQKVTKSVACATEKFKAPAFPEVREAIAELNELKGNNVSQKSVPGNKNTASEDTVSAHYKITPSVENKALTENNTSKSVQSVKKQTALEVKATNFKITESVEKEMSKEMACIVEDVDIFHSGSLMGSQQTVQEVERAASEVIAMNTVKTQDTQTRAAKRDRESDNQSCQNKKHKCDSESLLTEKTIIAPQETQAKHTKEKDTQRFNDPESMDFDIVVGKVFADIDADIEQVRSQSKSICTQPNVSKTIVDQNVQFTQNSIIDLGSQMMPVTVNKTPQNISSLKENRIKADFALFKENTVDKFSENVLLAFAKEMTQNPIDITPNTTQVENLQNPNGDPTTQDHLANLLTPNICDNFEGQDGAEHFGVLSEPQGLMTPSGKNAVDVDSDTSIFEETPQKSIEKYNSINKIPRVTPEKTDNDKTLINNEPTPKSTKNKNSRNESHEIQQVINLSDTLVDNNKQNEIKSTSVTELVERIPTRKTLQTPGISRFVNEITYKSTPIHSIARKSLNFSKGDSPGDQTCISNESAQATTLEKEIMQKAFEGTPELTPLRKQLSKSKQLSKEGLMKCIACSCLQPVEIRNVKTLVSRMHWTFKDDYVDDLTHLVVGVVDGNKSQRSVKYMRAVAAGKWIVSYAWVARCLQLDRHVDESEFEVVDTTGEPGPMRARMASVKLFAGFTFYCEPPFTVPDLDVIKELLRSAGATLASSAREVRVRSCRGPVLLLAEPTDKEEQRLTYMAIKDGVVPVNVEWAINCLGSCQLQPIGHLLLCPDALVPLEYMASNGWPHALLASNYEFEASH